MKSVVARAFFVLAPAAFWGGLFALIHPLAGCVVAAGFIYIGLHVTKRRLDRGDNFYG